MDTVFLIHRRHPPDDSLTRFLTLLGLCLFHEASFNLRDIHRPASQPSPSFSIYLIAKKSSLIHRDNGMSPDLPPPPLAQALIAIRDCTEQLGLLLRAELLENSAAKCAFDELVRSVSCSLSLAEDIGSTSCVGKRKSSSASYHKRRICRRRWRSYLTTWILYHQLTTSSLLPVSGRSRSYSCPKVLSKTLDDGHSWRKYGQKDIQSAKYPRYIQLN